MKKSYKEKREVKAYKQYVKQNLRKWNEFDNQKEYKGKYE